MLDRFEDVEVVGEASNGEEAVQAARDLEPDVVLTAVTMPYCNGIETTRQIKACLPSTKVLALTTHCEGDLVAEMLKAGASGYILKSCTPKDLSRAIETVCAGQNYLCPEVTGVVVDGFVNHTAATKPSCFSALTRREREVLQLLAEGKTIKEIARHLSRSPKTIEMHRRHLMEKLGVHTDVELAKFALRMGLTSLHG